MTIPSLITGRYYLKPKKEEEKIVPYDWIDEQGHKHYPSRPPIINLPKDFFFKSELHRGY